MKIDKYLRLLTCVIWGIVIAMLCSSCDEFIQAEPSPTATMLVIPSVSIIPTETATTHPTATTLPDMLYDALPVMQGICFEGAWDAAGTVFIIRNAEEHIHFYNLADNSNLCRHPVERYPFDFAQGDVLAGLWNRGHGCIASHSITSYQRNDVERSIQIDVQFSVEGDCNYELVRGFWLGIVNARDYQIQINWGE